MQEEERLRELLDYKILDTPPEKDLDELALIASAVCDTPMSLVSFIDSHRQWYKAKKGIDANEVPRTDSFCQFALNNPNDVMVVDDPLKDDRFKHNRYVTGEPFIRFYAGAPMKSATGQVMGTLCVMDSKHHDITEGQKHALQLLAKKAMQYVSMRKIMVEQGDKIEYSASKLKKLTDLVPGVIFQLEVREGVSNFSFLSKGIELLHPQMTVENIMADPRLFYTFIHDDDRKRVEDGIRYSLRNEATWEEEFRIDSGETSRWFWANARVERKTDGTLVMYGTLQDITSRKKYDQVLDQILHDVSHVMRRPVTSMLGLTELMEHDVLDVEQLRVYMSHVKKVFSELDAFTRHLNQVYHEKRAQNRQLPGDNGRE